MKEVWVDGSCKGKCGGWAFVMDKQLQSGRDYPATNNRMELTAILKALQHCVVKGYKEVIVHTDSKYAIGVCTGTSRAKANVELVMAVRAEMDKFDHVELVYEEDVESSNLRLCHNTAIGQAVMCSKEDNSNVAVSVPLILLEEIEHFLTENNCPPRLIRAIKECKGS